MISRIYLIFFFLVTICAAPAAQMVYYLDFELVDNAFFDWKGTLLEIDLQTCSIKDTLFKTSYLSGVENAPTSDAHTRGYDGKFYLPGYNNNLLSIELGSDTISVVTDIPYSIRDNNAYIDVSMGPDSLLYLLSGNNARLGNDPYFITYDIKTRKFSAPIYFTGVRDQVAFIAFIGSQMYLGGAELYIVDDNWTAHPLPIPPQSTLVLASLVTIRQSCDSTVFLLGGGNNTGYSHPARFTPLMSTYDINTGDLGILCDNLDLWPAALSVDYGESAAVPCFLDLNLDRDGSSHPSGTSDAVGDYADTTDCSGQIDRISDTDVSLMGNTEVDSILLTWPAPYLLDIIVPPSPLVKKVNQRSTEVSISLAGGLSLDTIAAFIQAIEGRINNLTQPTTIPVELVMYYKDRAYDTAAAHIFSPVRSARAPGDTTVLFCKDVTTDLTSFLTELNTVGGTWSGDLMGVENATAPGSFDLFLAVPDPYCPSDTQEVTIDVVLPEEAPIMGDEILCPDEAQTLSVDQPNASTLVWQDGSQTSTLEDTGPGTYHIQLADGNGCVYRDTLVVTSENNNYALTSVGDICEEVRLSVTGDDYTSILWSTGDTTPQITITESGTFSATITSNQDCPYEAAIEVEKCQGPLIFPNIFSPNGDGMNDELCFEGLGISVTKLMVYDRWGGIVFRCDSDQGSCCWDGRRASGKEVSTGVYVLYLEIQEDEDKLRIETTDVTLVR